MSAPFIWVFLAMESAWFKGTGVGDPTVDILFAALEVADVAWDPARHLPAAGVARDVIRAGLVRRPPLTLPMVTRPRLPR